MPFPAQVASRWVLVAVCATALVAGLSGILLGALLLPRVEVVEKPMEVLVEKRVEVPVEKRVVIERKVEMPPPPFSYRPAAGGSKEATHEEITVALLMRDDIRKATAAATVDYEASALFDPGTSITLLLEVNQPPASGLSAEVLRRAALSAFEAKGFKVLADDEVDDQCNTLVHVEVEVTDGGRVARLSVTVRQTLLAFGRNRWGKVNMGVARYGSLEVAGRASEANLLRVLSEMGERAATDLAKVRQPHPRLERTDQPR